MDEDELLDYECETETESSYLNFFNYWNYWPDNEELIKDDIVSCPICDENATFKISFRFEPYQGSYDSFNTISIKCQNCDLQYDEIDARRTAGTELYEDGLNKYKKFIKKNLNWKDPSNNVKGYI